MSGGSQAQSVNIYKLNHAPLLDGKPARETCACSCPEGLAGSGAELLNARLACVEARSDLPYSCEHGDASIVYRVSVEGAYSN